MLGSLRGIPLILLKRCENIEGWSSSHSSFYTNYKDSRCGMGDHAPKSPLPDHGKHTILTYPDCNLVVEGIERSSTPSLVPSYWLASKSKTDFPKTSRIARPPNVPRVKPKKKISCIRDVEMVNNTAIRYPLVN